jgi:hypothetical protein
MDTKPHQLTLWLEDSPVRTLASPEKGQDSPASDRDFGANTPALLTSCGPATLSPKMSRPFALADWSKCSGRSLRSGMMRSGIVCPLPTLAPLTAGIGCGSWPTPTATLGKDGPERKLTGKDGGPVEPNARMYDERGNHVPLTLDRAVRWWPTPTVQDSENTAGPSQFRRNTLPLNAAVCVDENGTHRPGGLLNPTWVEWLMGYPLGWTALDASVIASFRKLRSSSSKRSKRASKASEPPRE